MDNSNYWIEGMRVSAVAHGLAPNLDTHAGLREYLEIALEARRRVMEQLAKEQLANGYPKRHVTAFPPVH